MGQSRSCSPRLSTTEKGIGEPNYLGEGRRSRPEAGLPPAWMPEKLGSVPSLVEASHETIKRNVFDGPPWSPCLNQEFLGPSPVYKDRARVPVPHLDCRLLSQPSKNPMDPRRVTSKSWSWIPSASMLEKLGSVPALVEAYHGSFLRGCPWDPSLESRISVFGS